MQENQIVGCLPVSDRKFNFIDFKIVSAYTNKYINKLKQAFKIDMIIVA
jgi:hypothetical protein